MKVGPRLRDIAFSLAVVAGVAAPGATEVSDQEPAAPTAASSAISAGEGIEAIEAIAYPEGYQGPAYGSASDEQIAFLRAVAECSGLMLDPVYSGKALFGLSRLPNKPRRALFIHTGGLPGLLAQADRIALAP